MFPFKFLKVSIYLSMGSMMLGCAATGPSYKDFMSTWQPLDKSSARVFFYKEEKKDFFGIASTAVFSVNSVQKGIVNWGGFNVIDLPPGTTKLSVSQQGGMGSCNAQVSLKENTQYFFKVEQRFDQAVAGFLFGLAGALIEAQAGDCTGAYKFSPVEPEVANERLSTLRLTN